MVVVVRIASIPRAVLKTLITHAIKRNVPRDRERICQQVHIYRLDKMY
jgi:hypothetical protein